MHSYNKRNFPFGFRENLILNTTDDSKLEGAVAILIELRNQARINKDFATSDLIRDQLKAAGINLKDGVDGIMIGRASIGNPWFFNQVKHFLKTGDHLPLPSIEERVKVVKEHLDFSIKWKGDRLGIVEMRRHYANYFKGIPNFKPIRTQLVTLETSEELYDVLNSITNKIELEPA